MEISTDLMNLACIILALLPHAAVCGTARPPAVRSVHLDWQKVQYSVPASHSRESNRTILTDLSGQASPGSVLAIMGPSGSGKSTLLDILAGQLPKTDGASLTGSVTYNSESVNDLASRYRKPNSPPPPLAYVRQSDLLFPQLTARETLGTAACLRLNQTVPKRVKMGVAENILRKLGLFKSGDVLVGDEKQRGLSGGEKKRLNLGVELVSKPSVIFADEPTSGLDSFQAEQVFDTLKRLAREGHTVVCSIHQPRSSTFNKFDDVLLLCDGHEIYRGPAKDIVRYFESLGMGLKLPANFNVAEWVIDLASVDYSSEAAQRESTERVQQLVRAWQDRRPRTHARRVPRAGAVGTAMPPALADGLRIRLLMRKWMDQFALLFRRAWRSVVRDKATLIARLSSTISSALVEGMLFYRLGVSQQNIQDRLGLLQVASVSIAMTSIVKTVAAFAKERLIVLREKVAKSYSVGPYFLSKLVAEIPGSAIFPIIFGAILYPLTGLNPKIGRVLTFLSLLTLEGLASSALGLFLGSFSPSVEFALALAPAVMLIFIVLGGLFINVDSVPFFLRWLDHASLIKITFEGLCVNEFTGLSFLPGRSVRGSVLTGEEQLDRLGFGKSKISKALTSQAMILCVLYGLTYLSLALQNPSFQRIRSPSTEPPQAVKSPLEEVTVDVISGGGGGGAGDEQQDRGTDVPVPAGIE